MIKNGLLKKIDKKLRYTWGIQIPYYIVRDFIEDIRRKQNEIEWKDFWLIVGRRGRGKTLTLVKLLDDFRATYGDRILIATNFSYAGRDINFTDWGQFLEKYEKPIIFAVDEIHQEYNNRNWSKFPVALLNEISESRKHGKMLIATAQVYDTIEINIRRMAEVIIFPKNIFGRFYIIQFHKKEDFEISQASGRRNTKGSIAYKTQYYIAHDELRERYSTKELIKPMENSTNPTSGTAAFRVALPAVERSST